MSKTENSALTSEQVLSAFERLDRQKSILEQRLIAPLEGQVKITKNEFDSVMYVLNQVHLALITDPGYLAWVYTPVSSPVADGKKASQDVDELFQPPLYLI